MRILTVLSTVAAAGLLVAGCGGDDVSDEEFIASVNEVCENTADDLLAMQEDLTDLSSAEEAGAFVEDELIPLFDGLIDDLEGVEVPDDKQDDYDRLIELAQDQRDIVAEDPEALFDPESDVATQLEENTEESNELASSLGVPEDCGEPAGGASGASGAE